MASLLGWLGSAAKRVGNDVVHPVNRAINIAGGVERQLNPFDNNATYKNPNPAPAARPSLLQQGEQVVTPTAQGSLGLLGALKNVAMIGPNDLRAGLGLLTHNNAATASALRQAGQGVSTVGSTLQAVPQLAARLELSANPFTRPGVGKETYHPNSGIEKTIFGKQPIQSYGTQFATNRKQGVAQALGQSIATISGDVGTAALLNQAGSGIAEARAAEAARNSKWNQPFNVSDQTRAQVGTPADRPTTGVKGGIAVNNYKGPKYLNNEKGGGPMPVVGDYSLDKPTPEGPKVQPKGSLENATKEFEANQSQAPAPLALRKVTSAQDAVRVGESVSSNFNQTANALANAQDKILGNSIKNRDLFVNAVEHPDQTATIAKNFKDPQAFLNLVQQHKAVTNREQSAFIGAGKARPFNATYIHHNVDLGTPEAQAAYDALSTTLKGGTSKSRLYPTLEDLQANGLGLKKMSAGDATRTWASRQTNIIRDATLENRLKSIDPNIQVVQVPGENPRFFSGDKTINKQLKGVQPYTVDNPLLKAANTVNTGVKQVGLYGGGFHDFKTTIRQFTTDVASGRNPFSRLAEGNKQMASNAAHEAWNQKQLDAGYGQIFSDADVAKTTMGQDLHGGVGATAKDLTRGSVENLNPYMKRLFNNKLDYYKKQLVIDEAKRNGITPANYDPSNLAMRKVVEQAGQGAQQWFGGLNTRVMGRSPITQQALKFGTLAPDFTEGKLRAAAGVVRGGEMGSLARRQVISEAVGTAILAEAASRGLTGKFTNPGQALLDPQVKTNMQDKKGRALSIGLPGSTVADLNRLRTDPSHFATAHLGAGLSTIQSAASGKDYYGNPLVDPFKNPNPNFGQNLVGALKSKGTIPGVQLNKYLSGKQDATVSVINTLGGRVGLDKNAQSYKDTQAFFKNQDNFVKGLNPNEQALFKTVNPTKKDASGQRVYDATIFNKAGNYNLLADNPAFAAKYQAYQQSQQGHDPLWDLPKDQLQSVLLARGGKTLPGQTYTKAGASLAAATGTDQQWYKDLLAKEQTLYGSLPKSTTPSKPIDYGPQPSAYVTAQLNAKNTKDPQVQQYLNARAAFTNTQRTQQGLKQIADFGQIGQPGKLDNPAQLAITPKGSSFGTGAPKKAGSGTGGRKATTVKDFGKALKLPKITGIKVAKAKAFKAPTTRKLAVGKLPKVTSRKFKTIV